MKKLLLLLLTSSFLPLPALRAADQDPQVAINAKLREGLRNTMAQLQAAQTDLATAQAAKTDLEAKNKDLEAKLAQLTRQSADDKTAADKTIADLKAQVAGQDARNARQVEATGKWKASFDALLAQAKTIDAKRAKLAQENILLTRKIEAQQRQNDELYTLGKDILHRYEHYGLGDAIANKEPFTGIAKVKFENYVQAQADALTDHKTKD